MAYDKAVDSSILDAALTATAERIREKTGSSDQLIWNETTGFADDVQSIDISSQSKTVTPSASQQKVTPDSGYKYLSQVTVKGDANLKAENIAEGVSIFGVLGTKAAGTQIATGTVTLSATLLTECTVDGLGFTPSRVVIIALDTYKYSGNSTAQVLITVDTSIASGDAGLSSPIYSWVTYSSSNGMAPFKVTVTNGQDMVKFTDGGFIIDTSTIKTNPYSGSTTYTGALKLPRYFKYIAIE